jgi:hypothetical protein
MGELYATWRPLSHLSLDGVSYDIGVKERRDGRFSVGWVCLNCCEQGPLLPSSETLAGATAFAEAGLRAHHALVHGVAQADRGIKAASLAK